MATFPELRVELVSESWAVASKRPPRAPLLTLAVGFPREI